MSRTRVYTWDRILWILGGAATTTSVWIGYDWLRGALVAVYMIWALFVGIGIGRSKPKFDEHVNEAIAVTREREP